MLDTGFTRLKRALVLKGITQEKLAGKMGLSKQAVSRKLNGTVGWSLKDVLIVGDVLELSNAELLGYFPRELVY